MCGICGIIGAFRERTGPAVRSMMHAMEHRGPDDEGYEERPIGDGERGAVAAFGFRRLSILDLTPAGHQPMVDPATGNCLVFNGEIYNFRHLRNRLATQGVKFRSTGDTEVLLKALTHWGEAAIDELDGMFAFAFYDAGSRRVLLARDHLGIKPLYVARLPRAVVFASEVRALLASGLVPDDLDPAGLATYFAYGAPQDPLTVHKAIRSLPAGTLQWFGAESVEGREAAAHRRWWRFPRIRMGEPEHTLVDRIEQVCADSVRDQCVADVPLVVFLSGGIDSATVAALARRNGDALFTFTVGNSTSAAEDETAHARQTAEFLRSSHHETVVDDVDVGADWTDWTVRADRPSVDGFNTLLVSKAVKAAGNTVALSGHGADELFGGYITFDEVRRLRRLVTPASFLPGPIRRGIVPALSRLAPAHRRARIVELFGAGTSYLDLTLLARRIQPDPSLRLLGFDHAALGLSEHWLPPEAYEPFSDVNDDLFHTVSQAETLLYLGNTLLRDTDVNSMRCSLETRVPFLGRKVVDLVGSIPGRLHFPPGPPRKHLLRQVASRLLPPDVIERPKRGFWLPYTSWMEGPLRTRCRADLDTLRSSPAVDPAGIDAVWKANVGQPGFVPQARRMSLVVLGSYLGQPRAVTSHAAV